MLDKLRDANHKRLKESKMPGADWSLEKWVLKIYEEMGEFSQSIIKDKTFTEKEDEAADIVITLDIVCSKLGINLEEVIKRKFNQTSARKGSSVLIY